MIGTGMLARAFSEYQAVTDIVIFASGVSNSKEMNRDAFEREKILLNEHINYSDEKLFIYFSTASINDEDQIGSAYVQHKISMENIISSACSQYLIFRLTNPIGQTNNSTTILNFLVNKIKEERAFTLWSNASRNLMDIDDVVRTINYFILQTEIRNVVLTIANPQTYALTEIVSATENYCGKKARPILENKGGSPILDVNALLPVYEQLGINFDSDYLENLLKKYF